MRGANQDETGNRTSKKTKTNAPLLLIISAGVIFIFAILAAVQLSKSGSVLNQKGAPVLKVDVEEINLGDIPVGQTVQASFRLTNSGTQSLKFREAPYIEVKEGC